MSLAAALVILTLHVHRVGPDPRDLPPIVPAAPSSDPIAVFRETVAAGRGMVGQTALTIPKRRVELSVKVAPSMLGLVEAAAGLTSTTEVWADAGTGLGDSGTTVRALGIKQAIVRAPQAHFSLTSSLRWIDDGGFGQFGGTLTTCTEDCALAASVGVSALWERNRDVRGAINFAVSTGSSTRRFLLDLYLLEEGKWALLGLRLGSAKIACDVGLVATDNGGEPDLSLIIGGTARL